MKNAILPIVLSLLAFSCKQGSYIPEGLQSALDDSPLEDTYAFIPVHQEVDGHQDSSRIPVMWMSRTEISNIDYRKFLQSLKKQGRMEDYKTALYDSSAWQRIGAYYTAYEEYYASHPVYTGYPVVCLTYEAAMLYCKWIEEMLRSNAKLPENLVITEIRLPTREEWEYAARGGNPDAIYPWGSKYLWNFDVNYYYCNFKTSIREEGIRYNPETQEYEVAEEMLEELDYSETTGPVMAYWPNAYGLYNMSGNVAEMLNEPGHTAGGSWDSPGYNLRIDAPDMYQGITEASPYIGLRPVIVGYYTKPSE